MKQNQLSSAIAAHLRGSKGEKPRAAVEAPDSLSSIAIARVMDLVSEGEIEGFPSGANWLRDVYLNETPVMNADGTMNFQNIKIEARTGTQSQSYIPGFPAVENEIGVGVELKASTPWTRSVTNKALSAVRIRLMVDALSKTNNENGDIGGHSVQYAIDVATDGGAYVEMMRSAFTGKTNGAYERAHRVDLPKATVSGWNIRVRRITADNDSSYIQDTTRVSSFTEIIDGKFRYPMSAVVGVEVDASQFQSIPTRSYRLRGRKIRVPVNYDPVTRTYSGSWNGTFKVAYSNNPAWVFYDLTTNKRYGLGKLVNELVIDKWALYAIAQYCDETVPNQFGGTEPRMTCNLYLQRDEDAYKVIQDLASVFRGICYWAGGAVVPVADRPMDPVYTYTNANVLNGTFRYESTGRRARHTAVIVGYNDSNDFSRIKYDYYDDQEMVDRFGFQLTTIMSMGATSRGQAQRTAKHLLLSEKLLTQAASWTVGIDGTFAVPGQIVRLADKYRAGRRIGGRVTSATASVIILDKSPEVLPGAGDTLIITLPTGTTETRTVQSYNASTRGVTVATPFSAAPIAESVWAIESTALKTQLYRVMSVKENEDGSYSMFGIQHNPSIFAAVDFGEPISVPPTSILDSINQARPASVTITSVERAGQVIAMPLLTATWPAAAGAMKYQIQWRKDNGEWTPLQDVAGTTADYQTPFPGDYEARVYAINSRGSVSAPRQSLPFTLGDQSTTPGFVDEINAAIAFSLGGALDQVQAPLVNEAIADGQITCYFQATTPGGLGAGNKGDIWFRKMGTAPNVVFQINRWDGAAWVVMPDYRIAQAIQTMSGIDPNGADDIIWVFVQNTPPSATGYGDFWVEPDTNYSVYVWGLAGTPATAQWIRTTDQGLAGTIVTAVNIAAISDGGINIFYQNDPPVIGTGEGQAAEGDFWIETDNGNFMWRVTSGVFVDANNSKIGQALTAATTAQGTADGKVKTWFQATAPTAPDVTATKGIGDLWFNTSTKKIFRWNGANWNDNIADITLDQIGGSGVNLMPDNYSVFEAATLPADMVSFGGFSAPSRVAGGGFLGVGALRLTISDGSTERYWFLGRTTPLPFNVPIQPGKKYIISAWVKGTATSVNFRLAGNTFYATAVDTTTAINNSTHTRVSGVMDTSAWPATDSSGVVRIGITGATGSVIDIDGVMVEEQKGRLATPSAFVRGVSGSMSLAALIAAQSAQATADGNIDIYRQASAPAIGGGGGAKVGDYWQDTTGKWWYCNGSVWVDATDARLPQVITDLQTTNGTVSTKTRLWIQEAQPTATTYGDTWFQPSTKLTRYWNGSAWSLLADQTENVADMLVVSPNFDAGLQGWTAETGWYLETSGNASMNGGQGTIHAGSGAGGHANSRIYQQKGFPVSPGSRIFFSAKVNNVSNTANGDMLVGLLWYNSAGSLISETNKSFNTHGMVLNYGNWKTVQGKVTVPSGATTARFQLFSQSQTAGYYGFDECRVSYVDDVTEAPANGVNMVPNSNFSSNEGNWPTEVSRKDINQMVTDGWYINTATGYLAPGAASYAGLEVNGVNSAYRQLFMGDAGGTIPSGSSAYYATTKQKFQVVAGEKYTLEYEYQVDSASPVPAGVTRFHYMGLWGFDKDGSRIWFGGVNNNTTGSFSGEYPLTIPSNVVQVQALVGFDYSNAGGAVAGGWAITHARFRKFVVRRVLNLDSGGVEDGATNGRVNNTDLSTFRRVGLRIIGSRQILGGARNSRASIVAGFGSVRSTTAITANSSGQVSINAHSVELGGETVTYNAVTNAIVGLTPGVTYVIFTLDPFLDGGTRTYYAQTNVLSAQQAGDGAVLIGNVTIPSSGTSSGGGGGTGNPGDWCVDYNAVLPTGWPVRNLVKGDMVLCVDITKDVPVLGEYPVLDIKYGHEASYRLKTESGVTLTQSASTPMDTYDGRIVKTPDMLNELVYVRQSNGKYGWDIVTEVEPVGLRRVVKLNLGGRMYFAGDTPAATIATHNINAKP